MRVAVGFMLFAGAVAWYAVRNADDLLQGKAEVAVTEPAAPVAKPVAQSGARKVAIPADRSGHFFSNAVINGRSIEVVVDTGATTVALTAETASRLGLKLDRSAFNRPLSTANGKVFGARVTLAEIRIGAILVESVEAVVLPQGALGTNLLGMSFLNRLRKFEVGGGQLVLMQ